MNKTILYTILNASLAFLFFYLIGCFIGMSFNISNWKEETRTVIGIMGGLASFGVILLSIMTIEND